MSNEPQDTVDPEDITGVICLVCGHVHWEYACPNCETMEEERVEREYEKLLDIQGEYK